MCVYIYIYIYILYIYIYISYTHILTPYLAALIITYITDLGFPVSHASMPFSITKTVSGHSWSGLGAVLGRSRVVLDLFRRSWGRSWGGLGRFGGGLGVVSSGLGAVLGGVGVILERSWSGGLGRSWASRGDPKSIKQT